MNIGLKNSDLNEIITSSPDKMKMNELVSKKNPGDFENFSEISQKSREGRSYLSRHCKSFSCSTHDPMTFGNVYNREDLKLSEIVKGNPNIKTKSIVADFSQLESI